MNERAQAAIDRYAGIYGGCATPEERAAVRDILAAADAADCEAGVVRVDTRDEQAVEKVARVLAGARSDDWDRLAEPFQRQLLAEASRVLAALEGAP